MFERLYEGLITSVVMIGCGGTGSRVVPLLVQILKNSPRALAPKLFLVDDDVVEHKNLARQNFILRDVSRNKAEVLAERYSVAMDFPILAIKERISGSNMNQLMRNAANSVQAVSPMTAGTIFILCVDSMEARIDIIKQLPKDSIVIEAGNEDTYGNVTVFDVSVLPKSFSVEKVTPFYGNIRLPLIPIPSNRYMHALKNPSVKTGSCADLDQSAAINNLMAAGINSIVQNISYGIPIRFRTRYYDISGCDNTEMLNLHWFNENFRNEESNSVMLSGMRACSTDQLVENLREAEKVPEALLRMIS